MWSTGVDRRGEAGDQASNFGEAEADELGGSNCSFAAGVAAYGRVDAPPDLAAGMDVLQAALVSAPAGTEP